MLKLENIMKAEGGETHLASVSYTFEAGKLYTILGRTGAGKTSLLRALMGLTPVDDGRVLLDGDDVTDVPVWNRNIAMVYQQFINYPHLDVLHNVAFPLVRRGMKKTAAHAKARDVLALVGMSEMERRKPSELSGGQQQRVALARALAKDSKVLMMDEPLVNLDYKLREQLREQFPRILERNRNSVILYTTTEPREAMQLGDEILVMHEGRIVDSGPPKTVFRRPKSIAVAKLVGDPPISIVAARMNDGRLELEGGVTMDVSALPLPPRPAYLLGVRPEKIRLGGSLRARVALAEISGSGTVVHLTLPFGDMVMLLAGVEQFAPDDEIDVGFGPEDIFFFDTAGELVLAPENPER